MPRRNRRPKQEPLTRPAPTTTPVAAPTGRIAQRIKSDQPGPDYTCPRCSRPVARASEHIVAWRDEDVEARRHWHNGCWTSAVREGIDRYP